ncbi:SDR family NAD(P)-dependent oxidoreductase [Aliiglaciecola sp. 2_MG-2023]|uniref:SDR family NAD(P)-dependent oxidoreductase n=1 Tax=unclassified Aliiglaciecola TaxID=2593648 RepID=UPI0026E16EEF|nr:MULTISPECIES: SDR family NAD(P)-dependent oxidoreductase [unclassified Aliiglaciecola]MDO6710630.1 SDR family NAD(P)-dependent oxidoreductase [Aliiglaciecola sp. 2_MG-2023]MDO6754283.1 SDR family NAD(P)-dependent oxidoreductase [Aliiglaciecola sp. 1_MG-2023]
MATILITGTGSGLGASLASELANDGHTIIATVRSLIPDNFPEIKPSSLGTIKFMQMDVTKIAEIKGVMKQLSDSKLTIDTVILNAAHYPIGTIESANYEYIKQCFEVNYWGNINVIREVMPFLRQQRYGKIIGVSSLSSAVGLPCDGHYSASKAAMDRMLESLRYEVSAFGIQVSSIQPASFASNLFKSLTNEKIEDGPYSQLIEHWMRSISNAEGENGKYLEEIHNTIRKIIANGQPEFLYTVGAKATEIAALLASMSSKEREEAILNWSDTDWWANSKIKAKL